VRRIVLGIAAVLFLIASPPASAADAAGPAIRFEQTRIDYGKVPAGKIVRPRFRFRNAGGAPLKITNSLWRGKFIRAKTLEGC